jgi:hypothetical protein
MFRKGLIVVALATVVLAACAPVAGSAGSVRNTLTVTGQSQVALTPDIAYVSIGVRTEGPDVGSAVSRNANVVDDVMAVMEGSGISPEDMRTSNFSVYSSDQYSNTGERIGLNYFVDNTVYVTVRDLASLGDLLDDAVDSGANSIWGVQFDVSDRSAATAEARDLAVADANAQAEALAGIAGLSLGDLVSISFSQGGAGLYPSYGGIGGGGGDGGYVQSATTIVPGQISVNALVYMVYETQ